jgi:hypothetical protein
MCGIWIYKRQENKRAIWEEGREQWERERRQKNIMGGKYDQSALCTYMKMS